MDLITFSDQYYLLVTKEHVKVGGCQGKRIKTNKESIT